VIEKRHLLQRTSLAEAVLAFPELCASQSKPATPPLRTKPA